jgi:hypothetical protein
MSYKTVADMADSYSLSRRLIAGAAKESIDDPQAWAQLYRWELASQPGWDAAWDSAQAADPGSDHGSNEAVITDGMILSGIQAVWAANQPDPEPEP